MNRSIAALIVVTGLGAGSNFSSCSDDAEADSEKSALAGRVRGNSGGGSGFWWRRSQAGAADCGRQWPGFDRPLIPKQTFDDTDV
jgi:hypothetical protein